MAQELFLSLLMLCIFDFIRWRLDYKSGFFLQINILEGRAGYVVLKGHISVTISYLSHWLTTETINYINENSFIENLAKLKYSMWAQRGKQM